MELLAQWVLLLISSGLLFHGLPSLASLYNTILTYPLYYL